jgi:hypothetical protein
MSLATMGRKARSELYEIVGKEIFDPKRVDDFVSPVEQIGSP